MWVPLGGCTESYELAEERGGWCFWGKGNDRVSVAIKVVDLESELVGPGVAFGHNQLPPVKRQNVVVRLVVGIVAAQFREFGNVAAAVPAFDVEEQIKGVGDLRLQRVMGNLDARDGDAVGETGDGRSGGVGVDCGE